MTGAGRRVFRLARGRAGALAWGMGAREKSPALTGGDTPADLVVREAAGARRFFRPGRDGEGDDAGAARGAGWRVAGAGCETIAGGAYLQQREFPYHKIEYIAAGRGWAELGGLRQGLAAGAAYASAPDARLGLRSDAGRPLRRYYLWLAGDGAGEALAEAGLGRARVRAVVAPGEIREAWEWLLREGAGDGPRAGELTRRLAEVLLLKLADARDAGAGEAEEGARESLERCRDLVDADAARLRGAADLAAAAGLRTETVCRLFRRFLDTTPGAYLRTRRMRLAAERLRAPDARVKEVAAELGFADAFHFSRVFKAEMGVGPRAWKTRGITGGE